MTNKYIILFCLNMFLIPTLYAMEKEQDTQDTRDKIEAVLNFQKQHHFVPGYYYKSDLLRKEQRKLDIRIDDKYKDSIRAYAVENLSEANKKLKELLSEGKSRRLAIVDLDETIFFPGAFSWIIICLNKIYFPPWDLPEYKDDHKQSEKGLQVLNLLNQYGFDSIDAFNEWGKRNFSLPITKHLDGVFYYEGNVINGEYSQILNNWYKENNIDVFSLTARMSIHSHVTIDQLMQAKIDMKALNSVEMEESGIIYTNGASKFGFPENPDYGSPGDPGNRIIEEYLKKITKEKAPECLDLIIVDNSLDIFKEVMCFVAYSIQELEKKYNIKIRVIFFMPIEENWLSPHYYWYDISQLNIGTIPAEDFAINVLTEFLKTFRGSHKKAL